MININVLSFFKYLMMFNSMAIAIKVSHAQTIPTRAADNTYSECKVKDTEIQGLYVGECDINGFAHGQGTVKGNIATYTGQFNHGYKQGNGVKHWFESGDTYVGQFDTDNKHGLGTYVWGESSKLKGYQYTGQFKLDKRDGQGIFKWENGESYAGEWKNNAQIDGLTPSQILQVKTLQAKEWKPVQTVKTP